MSLNVNNSKSKVIMQGKLFQRCTHLLYSSVLSLGGNVNTIFFADFKYRAQDLSNDV